MRERGLTLKQRIRTTLEPRVPSYIDETDISDTPAFFQTISALKEDHPIFRRLSEKSKNMIKSQGHAASSALPENKKYASIIEDLNAMLLDQALFYDLVHYYYHASGTLKTTNPPIENPVFAIQRLSGP